MLKLSYDFLLHLSKIQIPYNGLYLLVHLSTQQSSLRLLHFLYLEFSPDLHTAGSPLFFRPEVKCLLGFSLITQSRVSNHPIYPIILLYMKHKHDIFLFTCLLFFLPLGCKFNQMSTLKFQSLVEFGKW